MFRKKMLFFAIVELFFSFIGYSQSCLPEGIQFTTQAQIDNFQVNYPDCSEILGDVDISNSITNLNGLSVLTSIGGNLFISGTSLTNLTGLDNISIIGKSFSIMTCSSLTTLSGMENLTSIGENFYIDNNALLNNLTALHGLNFIGGDLVVSFNPSLVSLTGLEELTSIGGYFSIYQNGLINNLVGLNSLTSIGEYINISVSNSLTSLAGLENLTIIGGSFRIHHNDALISLEGCDNIEAGSIAEMKIYANDSLSTCDVQSICNYLAAPNGTIEIHDNATGCDSVEEVEAACGVGYNEIGTLMRHSNIYPNPASNTITIEPIELINQNELTIFNVDGQALDHYKITELSKVIDISHLAKGVYLMRFTSEKEARMFKVLKY